MKPASTEADFIDLFERLGAQETANKLGINVRSVHQRRRHVEGRIGRHLRCPAKTSPTATLDDFPGRIPLEVKDGIVLVGSDSHYYPGIVSTAHRAFVKFCKDLKPAAIIKNGDELDFPSISRHPPIGWENVPSVQMEIETTQDRLEEIEKASPNSKMLWALGNHDARFSVRLATVAREYANVHGLQLKDHFPRWTPCWSVWINDDVVVKHRFKGGLNANLNSTLWAGKTMVNGHLHSSGVTALTDYNGTRWGVNLGTMADPYGPQFEYLEDGVRNWRSAFGVLTFVGGELLWPELVHVRKEGQVEFRGQLINV